MKHTVFVSYAREDRDLLAPLLRALSAKDRPFDLFIDTSIPVAADWDTTIRAQLDAASVVLMFTSPDWEAKDYCTWERDRALQRHDRDPAPPAARRPQLVPILLRPVHISASTNRSVFRFQSPWDPKTALVESHTTPAQWDRAGAELVAHVERLLDGLPAPPPPPAPRPAEAPYPHPLPPAAHRSRHGPRLDLHAERHDASVSWRMRDHERGLDVGQWTGSLSPSLLDGSWIEAILSGRRKPAEVGDDLGRALLGGAPHAWQHDDRHGLGAPHRVRLITADPTLASLPWRWLRTRGWWLSEKQWTWELSTRLPSGTAHLAAHSTTLLLLPAHPGGDTSGFAQAITGLLDQAWQTRAAPLLAREAADLAAARAPRLVLQVAPPPAFPTGACAVDRGAGHADLRLDTWLSLLRAGPTELLLQLGLGAPLPLAVRGVPKGLLTCTLPLHSGQAQDLAQALLSAVLRDRQDPVRAVEAVHHHHPSLAASALLAHTEAEDWDIDRPPGERPDPRLALLLADRHTQRDRAAQAVRDLARGASTFRVMLMLGLSPPDPRLQPEELHDTVLEHVTDNLDLVVHPTTMPWTAAPAESLDQHLKRQRDQAHILAKGGDLRAAVRSKAPTVLWLNAGLVCHGCQHGHASGAVSPDDVVSWMQATQEALAARLPDDPALWVVVWLTVVTADPAGMASRCQAALRKLPRGWSTRAMTEVLAPIGHLDEEHVYRFLLEKNSGCPPEHASAVAELLYNAHLDPNLGFAPFQPTIRALEQGVETGWAAWLARL